MTHHLALLAKNAREEKPVDSLNLGRAAASSALPKLNTWSQKIIKIMFRPVVTAQPKNMSRKAVRVEFNVVCVTVPEETGVGEQIVHLEGAAGVDVEFFERQVEPAAVSVVGIQIDDD